MTVALLPENFRRRVEDVKTKKKTTSDLSEVTSSCGLSALLWTFIAT